MKSADKGQPQICILLTFKVLRGYSFYTLFIVIFAHRCLMENSDQDLISLFIFNQTCANKLNSRSPKTIDEKTSPSLKESQTESADNTNHSAIFWREIQTSNLSKSCPIKGHEHSVTCHLFICLIFSFFDTAGQLVGRGRQNRV